MIEKDDEDVTARLLRLAGPRPEVPADRAARVRDAIHSEWRMTLRRRTARRRGARIAVGALASAAVLILAIRVWSGRGVEVETLPPADFVASVERLDGDIRLTSGDRLRAGEWVETGSGTRLALRLADRSSVRVDASSRMRVLSPSIIELTQGAVYLDTAPGSSGLEVRTPYGVARDIGTQFEIRVAASALRVRVRSGLVELRHGNSSLSARPGTEVTIGTGNPMTKMIPVSGPDWDWAAGLAPVFEIEGRPLAAFLEHIAREQGWTVRYGDGRLARDASAIILHGSVSGLPAREAIAVALRSSGLDHRVENDEVLVFREGRK